MKKEVLERLSALGADISALEGKSLQEDLYHIKFNNFLYDEEYIDIVGANIISDYLEEAGLTLDNLDEVVDRVLNHFWNYHKGVLPSDTYLGQTYYCGELMTPYDENTTDYEDWYEWFKNEADLSEIYEVVGEQPELSFVNAFRSHGFPDNYYICLQDPNPDNPTVFGTDHEAAFVEIENYGSLEEFLSTMLTKEEFRAQVKEYLEYLANQK